MLTIKSIEIQFFPQDKKIDSECVIRCKMPGIILDDNLNHLKDSLLRHAHRASDIHEVPLHYRNRLIHIGQISAIKDSSSYKWTFSYDLPDNKFPGAGLCPYPFIQVDVDDIININYENNLEHIVDGIHPTKYSFVVLLALLECIRVGIKSSEMIFIGCTASTIDVYAF